jgi:hypothetical protein
MNRLKNDRAGPVQVKKRVCLFVSLNMLCSGRSWCYTRKENSAKGRSGLEQISPGWNWGTMCPASRTVMKVKSLGPVELGTVYDVAYPAGMPLPVCVCVCVSVCVCVCVCVCVSHERRACEIVQSTTTTELRTARKYHLLRQSTGAMPFSV